MVIVIKYYSRIKGRILTTLFDKELKYKASEEVSWRVEHVSKLEFGY